MADYANENSGLTTSRAKPRSRKWLWIGGAVAVAVILAAVLGGVLGSRAHKNNQNSSTSGAAADSGPSPTGEAAASQAASIKEAIGLFPTATNSQYLLPLYPSTVRELRVECVASVTHRNRRYVD